jgi:predicted DNA-binding protein with PD1-like motif
MIARKIDNQWIIRLEKGEELVTTLSNFCSLKQINLGSLTGLGAINQVKLGLFDTKKKQYVTRDLTEDMEITSLIGNISLKEGKTSLHIHINVANSDFKVYGGHLYEAHVSATCEIILNEINACITRKMDTETGLYLLDLE